MAKVKLPQKTVKKYLDNLTVFELPNGEIHERDLDDIYFLMAAAMYGKDLTGVVSAKIPNRWNEIDFKIHKMNFFVGKNNEAQF